MTNPLMVDFNVDCNIVAEAQKTDPYFLLSAAADQNSFSCCQVFHIFRFVLKETFSNELPLIWLDLFSFRVIRVCVKRILLLILHYLTLNECIFYNWLSLFI
jgi:hypothetical protein